MPAPPQREHTASGTNAITTAATATRRTTPTSHGVTETGERESDIRFSLRWTVQPVVYFLKFEERPMTLLVAFALCLQDKTAEEIFKKIQEQIEKAVTISVKFKFRMDGGIEKEPPLASGTILLKNTNKVNLSVQHGSDKSSVIISDGQKVKDRSNGGDWRENDAPKTLKGDLSAVLAGSGIGFAVMFSNGRDQSGDNAESLKNVFKVSDFGTDADEKNAKTLTYKLKLTDKPSGSLQYLGKLWYDPKTYRLLKRTVIIKGEEGTLKFKVKDGEGIPNFEGEELTLSYTETYEEFTLNADISDEKFKLPAEK